MNTNTLLNAVIALLEDRPKDARAMLREPGTKFPEGEVLIRLMAAIRKRETTAQVRVLKLVLTESLRIDHAALAAAPDGDTVGEDDLVLLGVATVEKIIDEYIVSLDSNILA